MAKEMKLRCNRCEGMLAPQAFSRNSKRPDREFRHTTCKECDCARVAKWKKEHPEQKKTTDHRVYVKNRKKRLVQGRERYNGSEEVREQKAEDLKAWRQNNPEKYAELNRRAGQLKAQKKFAAMAPEDLPWATE